MDLMFNGSGKILNQNGQSVPLTNLSEVWSQENHDPIGLLKFRNYNAIWRIREIKYAQKSTGLVFLAYYGSEGWRLESLLAHVRIQTCGVIVELVEIEFFSSTKIT